MAKINVEFDTASKELNVSMDGKAVPNIYSVNLSKGYYNDEDDNEKFSCSLMTLDTSKQESDGYRQLTHIVAKESKEADDAMKNGAGTYSDNHTFLLLSKLSKKAYSGLSDILRRHRIKR